MDAADFGRRQENVLGFFLFKKLPYSFTQRGSFNL